MFVDVILEMLVDHIVVVILFVQKKDKVLSVYDFIQADVLL